MVLSEFIKKIPKKIKIAGDDYKISFVDRVAVDDMDFVFGLSDFANREIFLAVKDRKGKELPVSVVETTLYHELTHILLDAGQYLDLSAQEFIVEWVGRCIKDIVKAMGNMKGK